jgi:Tol biopolymer transport system component
MRKSFFLPAAVLLFFVCTAETPPPAASRLSRLTSAPHLEIFPGFSPDGNRLAFSSDRSGSLEIHVRQFGGRGAERKLTSDGMQNLQPAWSPDGKLIAYHPRRRDGIWIVPAQGGRPRRLTRFGSNPAWSPDGSTLVFQSDPFTELSLFVFPALPPSTLWLVPAAGGEPRQLTERGDPPGGHGAPSWSPDGRRIVFTAFTLSWGKLWTVSAAGDDLKQVEGPRLPREPVYSPDGQTLYYSGPDPALGFMIWRIPVTGGNPVPVQSAPARDLALSPDGQRLAFSHMDLHGFFWSIPVSPDTGKTTGPAIALTTDPKVRQGRPTFSPDGKRIAFYKPNPETNRIELWMMNADGSGRVRLSEEGTFASGQPIWMAGGSQIAFLSRGQGPAAVWKRIDLESRAVETMAKTHEAWTWTRPSPDGRRLAIELADSEGRVNTWVLPSLEGEPRQLTSDAELAGSPVWSRNGELLTVRLRRGSHGQIGVVPVEGGPLKQVTSGVNVVSQPDWSPDDSKLVFAAERDGFWNLWWVSRDGGSLHQVTDLPKKFNLYLRFPDWSPAGDRIAYEYGEVLGEIWMLDLCPGFAAECPAPTPGAG